MVTEVIDAVVLEGPVHDDEVFSDSFIEDVVINITSVILSIEKNLASFSSDVVLQKVIIRGSTKRNICWGSSEFSGIEIHHGSVVSDITSEVVGSEDESNDIKGVHAVVSSIGETDTHEVDALGHIEAEKEGLGKVNELEIQGVVGVVKSDVVDGESQGNFGVDLSLGV